MKTLKQILIPTQESLFKMLLSKYGNKAVSEENQFILVEGEAPIMLIAHLDTVHIEPVRDICVSKDGNILMSPQGIGGDDRCGVYALIKAYKFSKIKPSLLFTCNEETGGAGATNFVTNYLAGNLPKSLDELKCLVEIDRKGSKDAVYYDCANTKFEDYITSKGFKTDIGSFSDISIIAPELGVAAVNLSSGYYNAHTQHEYINFAELNNTLLKVIEIVADSTNADFPKYEYIERVRVYCKDDLFFKGKSFGGTKKKKSANKVTSSYIGYYDDFDDYEDCDSIMVPRQMSRELEELYWALVDFDRYTITELECMRDAYGDSVIREIYEDEFKIFDTAAREGKNDNDQSEKSKDRDYYEQSSQAVCKMS